MTKSGFLCGSVQIGWPLRHLCALKLIPVLTEWILDGTRQIKAGILPLSKLQAHMPFGTTWIGPMDKPGQWFMLADAPGQSLV
jgi:hypothetical protein